MNWPTFQQGYFTYPQAEHHGNPVQPTSQPDQVPRQAYAAQDYSYYIRLINSKKKSDFTVRFWHDEHSMFKSLAVLKIKLMDAFPNDIPTSTNVQLGYFEPPGATKRWLMDHRDLQLMYNAFKHGSKINLWCERGKGSTFAEDEFQQPPQKKRKTKKDEDAEEDDCIFDELKSKNPTMEPPKLHLWAKLIKSGRHESYEDPPQIPLITGSSIAKPKKETLADAFAGAASAIVKVLHDKPQPTKSPVKKDSTLSPMKMATLRRGCLEDLRKLKELLQDGVLTEIEFNREKQQILSVLQKY